MNSLSCACLFFFLTPPPPPHFVAVIKKGNMRYISTRGGTESVDFEGALFSGYAADGGLFMPQQIPVLDHGTLQKWSAFSYPELVQQLCSVFIPPELIPKAELNGKLCWKEMTV